jgi:hypothetical protein
MIPPRGLGFKTNSRPIARFAKLGHYLFAFCDTVPEGKRGNPEVNCRNQAWLLKKGYSEADVGGVWVPRSEEEFLARVGD